MTMMTMMKMMWFVYKPFKNKCWNKNYSYDVIQRISFGSFRLFVYSCTSIRLFLWYWGWSLIDKSYDSFLWSMFLSMMMTRVMNMMVIQRFCKQEPLCLWLHNVHMQVLKTVLTQDSSLSLAWSLSSSITPHSTDLSLRRSPDGCVHVWRGKKAPLVFMQSEDGKNFIVHSNLIWFWLTWQS